MDFITLFPNMIEAVLGESIIARGARRGHLGVRTHQLRDYTLNKQKQVDDYPYGGGQGMVMMADPLYRCLEHVKETHGPGRVILLSPQGRVFTQAEARRLAGLERLIFVCGRYEGVDERFIELCVDEELSLGDFVLTGGEVAAAAVADAVGRLIPGVLADEVCFEDESHWAGLLEYPQYTRPEVWKGLRVPEILLSGHHENIAAWRREQAIERTRERRPDLLGDEQR
jgi:tRNA (guanine37-N1)-methyltransferase